MAKPATRFGFFSCVAGKPAWVAGVTLTAALVLAQPFASAQEGNRDYYAPRTTGNDRALFKNVEQYHLQPGIDEMRKGRNGAALAHYEFILRYYPNHPRVLMLMSEMCSKWKVPACNAEKWFQMGIARNPRIAMTHLAYGVHLQRTNRLAEAIESYKNALAIDPSSMNAHYNLALAYFAQKQYALANQHAQASYELGAALPGLRDKLTSVGQWQPVSPELIKQLTERSAPEKVPEGNSEKAAEK